MCVCVRACVRACACVCFVVVVFFIKLLIEHSVSKQWRHPALILWRLILVCTVCPCPIQHAKRALGLYGLTLLYAD